MTYPYDGAEPETEHGTFDDHDTPDEHDTDSAGQPDGEDATLEDAETDKKSARRKAARPTRLTAVQVRRVLAQAELVRTLDGTVLSLLAAILGTSTHTTDLVVATLSAAKAPAEVLTDLLAVAAEQDAFKPVILAHTLVSDRDNARKTWAVLTCLDKVTGALPSKDIQAATTVATAAKELTDDELAGLRVAIEMLG